MKREVKDTLKIRRVLRDTTLLSLSLSPLLLIGLVSGSSLEKEVVRQVDLKRKIVDFARNENKRVVGLSNSLFDLSLSLGSTDMDIQLVEGNLNLLNKLTKRDFNEPKSAKEKIAYYLKREGDLVDEIATLQLRVAKLKRFEEALAKLRETVFRLKDKEDELVKIDDKLRLLKRRADVTEISYKAARANN